MKLPEIALPDPSRLEHLSGSLDEDTRDALVLLRQHRTDHIMDMKPLLADYVEAEEVDLLDVGELDGANYKSYDRYFNVTRKESKRQVLAHATLLAIQRIGKDAEKEGTLSLHQRRVLTASFSVMADILLEDDHV
ncbi:MAG: hypothetical protein AAF429_14275 [Pseudomonadota bacterium]